MGLRHRPTPRSSSEPDPVGNPGIGPLGGVLAQVEGPGSRVRRRGEEVNLESGSLFAGSSAPELGEQVHRLSTGAGWWIEQILSGTLPAPVDDVLDHEEWVVLTEGSAVLEVEGTAVTLERGDWIRLGPGTPHRVRTTRPGTSWLAVHLPTPPAVVTDHGTQ